jgi:LysM repeat protein
LRQSDQSASDANRYSSVYGPNAAAPGTGAPVEPTFAESWIGIQKALDEGKLSQGHQLLSKWYGDPSLTPAEAEMVETLLGQLAGTVVFSTEHRIEPARIVMPGETLESIAKEYNVAWQLLAKINGIPAADQIRPGQELKVVRGPFSAVVDLERKQLTLMLGDRYAGKFAITPSNDGSASEGEWVVQMRLSTNHLYLTSAEGPNAGPDALLVLGSDPKSLGVYRQRMGEDGQIENFSAAELIVSDSDAEELADILSIGSRVVVRR